MPYEPYNLFLDDLRLAQTVYPGEDWVEVRSFDAFVDYITRHGQPAAVSFDNDLGETPEGVPLPVGIAAMKWLYEADVRVNAVFIHSDNLEASQFIESYAKSWHKVRILDGDLRPEDACVQRRSALHRKWNPKS